MSRKRSTLPAADGVDVRPHQSTSNIPATKTGIPPETSRANTLPHNFSLRASTGSANATTDRRPSPPDFGSSTPRNPNYQDDGQAGSFYNPTIPPAAAVPLPNLQLGNPNLPDLKAVMFPSDNPFAYPNQPISTLEAQQYTGIDPSTTCPSPSPGSMFGLDGLSWRMQPATPSDHLGSFSVSGVESTAPPQFPQQGQLTSDPLARHANSELPPQTKRDVGNVDFQMGGYWPQANESSNESTGLTPGGVNLEDLFDGEGWGSLWDQNYTRP